MYKQDASHTPVCLYNGTNRNCYQLKLPDGVDKMHHYYSTGLIKYALKFATAVYTIEYSLYCTRRVLQGRDLSSVSSYRSNERTA